MAGIIVNRNVLDQKLGEVAGDIRSAFDKVEAIQLWLADHSGSGASDPLVTEFSYTEDEAYLIRLLFGDLNNLRTSNANTLALTHKLTGLDQ